MQLNYELTKKPEEFQVISPKNSYNLKPYYQTLVYNLVYFFTSYTHFGLIITENNSKINIIATTSKNQKLYFTLTKEEVTINYQAKSFTFNHTYDLSKIRLDLKSILFYYADQEIIEDFNTHEVSFKIKPLSVNKYYELIIPLTTYEVLNPTIFRQITSNSTLNDLHHIYQNYFQKYQSTYDYTEMPTILSVKELTSNSLSFDSIHLKQNKPTYYEFNLKHEEVDIRVSYNEITQSPLVTILGLNSHSDFDFSLVYDLLKKAETTIWHENIKLIKSK